MDDIPKNTPVLPMILKIKESGRRVSCDLHADFGHLQDHGVRGVLTEAKSQDIRS